MGNGNKFMEKKYLITDLIKVKKSEKNCHPSQYEDASMKRDIR